MCIIIITNDNMFYISQIFVWFDIYYFNCMYLVYYSHFRYYFHFFFIFDESRSILDK